LHLGERQAETALQLMRARYSAYAVGRSDYLWQTWHPRTRPDALQPNSAARWTKLEIVDVVAGQPGDDHGEVEFRAHFRTNSGPAVLHERSVFETRARRWLYVGGTQPTEG
jgi:SEC-C motif-containing protein